MSLPSNPPENPEPDPQKPVQANQPSPNTGCLGLIMLPFRNLGDIIKPMFNPKTRRTSAVMISLILFTCVLCVGSYRSGSVATDQPPTLIPTVNPTSGQSIVINTFTPTDEPTRTPRPTNTPRPIATNTPVPEPITLIGSGDSIVDFEKWFGVAIVKIKYSGGGNFVVRNYPANSNDYYELMVNTIGAYEGTQPLDLYDDQQTARFEVKAEGPWEIQILPFDTIRKETIPTVVQGTGDDVMIIGGGTPDLLQVDASQASSNFVLYGFSDTDRDLLVNEIAPYTGTTILDPGTLMLIIRAEGAWSLDITAR